MKASLVRLASVALIAAFAGSAMAALTPYSQSFEGLTMSDPGALANDGWKVFGNVFNSSGGYLYGYGPFPAPNGGNGFSAIGTGEGGVAQGNQYLNVYSDYNNGDHANGNLIEANVFQEQIISGADLGQTVQFSFDYKAAAGAGPAGSTTAKAFFKVLNPNSGFALVAFPTLETTGASSSSWASGSISLTIDSSWTGHILQFGFMNTATQYQPSAVLYDNINFAPVPEPATMTALAISLLGIAARRRRK